MYDRIVSDLKDLAINSLMNSPLGEKLHQAGKMINEVNRHILALSEKQGEEDMTATKIATVLTFGILRKIADGKKPAEFEKSDWTDIAKGISEYAILPSDDEYSLFIFKLYERYIRYSANCIRVKVPGKICDSIIALADELSAKGDSLTKGTISEIKYTEDCLWISLEAMIKLLASTVSLFGDSEKTEYAQAIASYAFEYGRLMLYSREQEIVNQFLESQEQMDVALEARYNEFLEDLTRETEEFYTLINNAFVPDYRSAFLQSILLAKATGVGEKDILKSKDDIDSFFLD